MRIHMKSMLLPVAALLAFLFDSLTDSSGTVSMAVLPLLAVIGAGSTIASHAIKAGQAGEYYGGKPVVPEFPSLEKLQSDALRSNLSNLSAIEDYSTRANTLNASLLKSMLESLSPGYGAMTGQIGTNINAQLRGEMPPDVQAAVQNAAAARAVGGGYGGAGMGRNLVARDFGLTSYQLTQQGLDSATRWLGLSAGLASGIYTGTAQMAVNPMMANDVAQSQWQRQWLANQVTSAPDPVKVGRVNALSDTLASIGSTFSLGGMMGGGGGGGGGGAGGFTYPNSMGGQVFAGGAGGFAGGGAGAATGMGALGFCWVAREVYGEDNPMWMVFREWMLNKAPKWLKNAYGKYGERFASWLKDKPRTKKLIRLWMNGRICSYLKD